MSIHNLVRSESTKLFTSKATWIVAGATILLTWPMAFTNAGAYNLPLDDPRLFSSEPTPPEFQGFEVADFGYVLVVVLAALWGGSEYGNGHQIHTTFAATPQRGSVFLVKAAILAILVGIVAFLTILGAIMITHSVSESGIDPWRLPAQVWAHIGGLTLAWVLTALMSFALGTLGRTAILPLLVITPLIVGLNVFIADFWEGARYLPITAGAAMYSDPAAEWHLGAFTGGMTQAAWALVLLLAAATRMPIEAHGFETAGFGQPIVILIAALLAGTRCAR